MDLKRRFIFILLSAVLQPVFFSYGQLSHYKSSSVLSSGSWTKMAVTKEGIYKLSYSDLKSIGIENPANISIYANNKGQLSFYNDGTNADDLEKVAFKIEKGNDNSFGEGDYILFYAQGTSRWKYNKSTGNYEFSRHYYCDTAYYFITSKNNDGLLISRYTQPTTPPDYVSASRDVYYRYENETANLLGSGREWYQPVGPGIKNNIDPGFDNVLMSENIRFRIRVLGRSDAKTSFTFSQGNKVVQTIYTEKVNTSDQNGLYASDEEVEGNVLPESGSPVFALTFNNEGNSAAKGWIDYVDIYARAASKYTSGQMIISDRLASGQGKTARFVVSGQAQPQIWDITDPSKPMQVDPSYSEGNISFNAGVDSVRKFILFSKESLLSPVIKGPVSNQNLHLQTPADMIIVTYPDFYDQAKRLADLHLSNEGVTSLIVTPQQIYNEFSGGIADAAAIRNYVKMIYERSRTSSVKLRYLLLFGDGSYENKTRPPGNTNFIPTWQSVNSTTGVLSFTSDDFYGLLDDGEGEADGYLDIGIGRIPVANEQDASFVVDKVGRYMSSQAFGSWRNVLCIVADDEDDNIHMNDAENLSLIAASEAPEAVVEKIYLDAFRQLSSISGDTYPDATDAINRQIESGCLLFNYVGHGSETGLAHEKVVKTDDIKSWTNKWKLPLVITATCEFSRFDNVTINNVSGEITANTSAGEMILLNPVGGGIALMSTTRVVYSAPNYTLNSNILNYAFRSAEDGSSMRLGDIIREAKINSGSGTNKRNFLLLGDPALKLAWPENGTIVTDSIRSLPEGIKTDTLKALSYINIKGHIENKTGSPDEGFNGTIETTVFDKEATLTTLGNDGGEKMRYSVPGNILYKGLTSVDNGNFSFTFTVPLDIDYSYGNGKIIYYAWNDKKDVNGCYDKAIVGGFSANSSDDTNGPAISLFMNDTLFRDGDITDASPVMLARLSDKSGINVSGSGIGHDITLWLDGNTAGSAVLNQYYKNDQGISSGTITYPFESLEDGSHYITLRAWDNFNNFSQKTLRFIVKTGGAFKITNTLCYPNPSSQGTSISISHNRPDENIKVTVKISRSNGELVRILKQESEVSGYKIPEIYWDGCTDSGAKVSGGIYIWEAEALTSKGEKARASGRIIFL